MKLNDLFLKSGLGFRAPNDIDVSGLSYDSRTIKRGDLFFAMAGVHADGHAFLDDVAKKGAVAAIVERETKSSLPTFPTNALLEAMSKISNVFFGEPSKRISVIGITGTNGKTTATYIVEAILRRNEKICGVLGTINYRIGSDMRPAPNTTPMSIDVQSFLSACVAKKVDVAVMEVSSHALELHRVDDVRFSIGVFTNLTQDHLDFHGTMENYYLAKRKLFKRAEHMNAVVNVDDAYGQRLVAEFPDGLTFAAEREAQLRAWNMKCDLTGVYFRIAMPSGRTFDVSNNLLGKHNVSNCLAAAGAMLRHGLEEEAVAKGLNQTLAVPGRLERVEAGQKFVVAVDYAHTPDALQQALTTLRDTGPRKLICVFGAGGDRDKTKRPKMGDVAVRQADFVYVTSDNPRSEDPQMIMRDIEEGIKKTGQKNYRMIEDREKAIHQAIKSANAGDVVLIAGKGHETYQIYGNEKIHFSDFEVAQKVLSA